MQIQESWYRSTADRGRRRLFPRGILALFSVTMLLVGLLALPSKALHERLANADESSLLTVAYLHAWLNATPQDWRLRMTLARHQAILGQHQAALASLDDLRAHGPEYLQDSVTRVRLNVLERLAWQIDSDTAQRRALLAQVGAELERVAATAHDPIEIEALYRRALAIEQTALASTLLARLSTAIDDARFIKARGRPVEQYAREAIALGDFRLASWFYWRAFDEARGNRRRLELLNLVARAEQAGGRLPEFFVALEPRRDRVVLDIDAYKRLARFALAANRLDLAERYAKEMLRFAAADAERGFASLQRIAQQASHALRVFAESMSPISEARAAQGRWGAGEEGMPPGMSDWVDKPVDEPAPVVTTTPPAVDPPPPVADTATPVADTATLLASPPPAETATPPPALVRAPEPALLRAPPVALPAMLPIAPVEPEPLRKPNRNLHHEPNHDPLAELLARLGEGPPTSGEDYERLTDALRVGKLVDRIYETRITATRLAPSPRPRLAWDPEAWELAWQVMLASPNLDDAYAIAWVAVERLPNNVDWNTRLAQVAEWSSRPEVALDAWFRLASVLKREEYWREVERLAVGLRDEARYVAVLKHQIGRSPRDLSLVVKLADTYERQGDPRSAIELIEQRLLSAPPQDRARLYEHLSQVAERARDAPLLIDALLRAERELGPDPERATRIAHAEHLLGHVEAAFAALERSSAFAADPARHDAAAEKRTDFWSTWANLANDLQRTPQALEGYRQLARLDALERDDLANLVVVLAQRSPSEAAEALAIGYRRFGDEALARQALARWLQAARFDEVDRFLASLPAALRHDIVASAPFLRDRAAALQASDRLREAMRDLAEVHRLAPNDMDNRAAMLWLALAQKDAPRVRVMLVRWRAEARRESRLWGPFGAALLALDEPAEALPYFVWQARANQDYLWWLAYADALSAAGRSDAAWQLRRRAWTELRKDPAKRIGASPAARERVVALAMQFAPPDEAAGLLRRLLHERPALAPMRNRPTVLAVPASAPWRLVAAGRLAPNEAMMQTIARVSAEVELAPAPPDPLLRPRPEGELRGMRVAASELAMSWLLSNEENDAARGWLLSRYANDLAKPAWARLSLALAANDHTELDELLETMPDWLPKLDRVQALSKSGRIAEAQTLAFDTAAARPDSDAAHETLVEQMTREQPSAGITTSFTAQDAYTRQATRLDGATRVNQHGLLRAWIERDDVRSRDAALLVDPGVASRTVGLGLEWTSRNGRWIGEIGQRTGIATSTPARLRWTNDAGPRLALGATLAMAQLSNDSAAMAAGGQKDLVGLEARYSFSKRDYVAARLELAQLETRLDTTLGSSSSFGLEYGHRLRIEYPDLTLRAVVNRTDNRRSYHDRASADPANSATNNTVDPIVTRLTPPGSEDPGAAFIGSSSTQFDLYATVGSTIVEGYSRAARPFLELGSHHNTVSGASVSARGGFGSALFGTDQLTIYAGFTSATQSSPGGSREVGLSYRLLY